MKFGPYLLIVVFVSLVITFLGLAGLNSQSPKSGTSQEQENEVLFFQGSAQCDECEIQKSELEQLEAKIGLQVMTYDVDKDRIVADRYNVWIVPTVIINGQKREGLVRAEELEAMLTDPADRGGEARDSFEESFPAAFALVAGLLTGLEPCALAFSGMIALFILGSEMADERIRCLFSASIFTATRAAVFASFGFAVAVLGASAGDLRFILLLIASAVAFFVGSSYLGWIELPVNSIAPSSSTLKKLGRGHFTPVILGLVFGFAVLPCATPVMASLLAYVAGTGNPMTGIMCLFLFGIALSTPVVVFAYAGRSFAQRLSWLLGHGKKLSMALGIGLLGLSLYLLYSAF